MAILAITRSEVWSLSNFKSKKLKAYKTGESPVEMFFSSN